MTLRANISWNLFGQASLFVLALVNIKLVFSGLGPEYLGYLAFSRSIPLLVISLVSLGFPSVIVAEVSSSIRVDRFHARSVSQYAMAYFLLLGISLSIAGWVGMPFVFHHWLQVDEFSVNDVRATSILVISQFILLPGLVTRSALRGIQDMRLANSIDVGSGLLASLGLAVALLAFDATFLGIAWVSLFCSIVSVVAGLVAVSFRMDSRWVIPWVPPGIAKKTWWFLSRQAGAEMISGVFVRLDELVLSRVVAVGAFGSFSVVRNVVNGFVTVGQVIGSAVLPVFGAASQSDGRACPELFVPLQTTMLYGSLLFLGLSTYSYYPVLGLIMGPEVRSDLEWPFLFLLVATYLQLSGIVPHALTIAKKRPDLVLQANLHIALPSVLVTLLLVWEAGILGAAISWFFNRALMVSAILVPMSRDVLRMAPRTYLSLLLKPLAFSLLAFGPAPLAARVFGQDAYLALAASCILGVFVFFGGFLIDGGHRRWKKVCE